MFTNLARSLLLGAACWQLLVGLPSSGQAAASASRSQLDVNFFYDTLKDDGAWFNTTEYGDVWQPYIAYKSDSWRPYTDGYWTYTDGGWMFVSYENFGWAVYHYGRWTQLKDIGWAWVPGTEWSPAWVTWRESKPGDGTENVPPAANVAATTTDNGDQPPAPPREPSGNRVSAVSESYIGWAPLPPDPEPVASGSYYSYGPSVDVDLGIDPYDYCFTDVRSFGSPWIGGVIFGRDRGYDYAERSVNVTNIYYNRQGGYRGFYNGGPRYERFNGITERPIPRLNLRRQEGRAAQAAIRAGQFNQINGQLINTAAPRFSQTNVRGGRVNFKNRGALPVTSVNRERPAAQANEAARDRARNTFRQQGDDFRARHPSSQSALRAARQAGNPAGAPGLATTPRARQEEREARQQGENPTAQPNGPRQAGSPAAAAARPNTKAGRRAARQEARRQQAAASPAQAGGNDGARGASRQRVKEARRAARQNDGSGARNAARQSVAREPRGGGGRERAARVGGGGRAFGGGGGGGGGGRQGGGGGGGGRKGGGGDGHGGGGGGKKKR